MKTTRKRMDLHFVSFGAVYKYGGPLKIFLMIIMQCISIIKIHYRIVNAVLRSEYCRTRDSSRWVIPEKKLRAKLANNRDIYSRLVRARNDLLRRSTRKNVAHDEVRRIVDRDTLNSCILNSKQLWTAINHCSAVRKIVVDNKKYFPPPFWMCALILEAEQEGK
jgi:hypothetical protein